MAVVASWDGAARRIYLATNSFHPIDLYREYREWRRADESARKWDAFMRMEGNLAKGGGKFTPRFLMLLSDGQGVLTKIVPMDSTHSLVITGEILTDQPNTDTDFIDTVSLSAASKVRINYAPPEAEVIVIDGTGGGGSLTSAQAQQLIDARKFALLAMIK